MSPEQQDRVARAKAEFMDKFYHEMLGLSWEVWHAGKNDTTIGARIFYDKSRAILGRAFDAALDHIREQQKPGQQPPQKGK